MTLTLVETIQRIVQEELKSIRTGDLGIVQEQHPHASDSDKDNYACTVQLRNSGIVLKHVPVVTPWIGSVSIPAVGHLVLVQFIGGDINAPIITGSLYNDEDRPPVNDDGQIVLHLPLGAEDNDAVHVALHSGKTRELSMKLGSGLLLHLRDDDPVIEVEIDGGKARVTIERDGAMTIESQGNMNMKAGEIALEGDAVTIKASGELNLKGATVNIN